MEDHQSAAKITIISISLVIILAITIPLIKTLYINFEWFQILIAKLEPIVIYGALYGTIILISLIVVGGLIYNLLRLFALLLFDVEIDLTDDIKKYLSNRKKARNSC